MTDTLIAGHETSGRPPAMMRIRLKADGRVVEIRPDGSEHSLTGADVAASQDGGVTVDGAGPAAAPCVTGGGDAAYAKSVRARTKLTQAEFAARIGVPIETVRNWEQGKRSPRGPARALLKVIDHAPLVAFAALSTARRKP
jgi:putative transcriptional regulator